MAIPRKSIPHPAYDDARRTLSAAFQMAHHRPLPDGLAYQMQHLHLLDDYIKGERSLEQVVDQAWELTQWRDGEINRVTGRPPAPPMLGFVLGHGGGPATSPGLDARWTALSHLVADDARKDQGVVNFRSQVLDDRLLQPDEVRRWILEHRDAEGAESEWHLLPLPDNWDFDSFFENAGAHDLLTTPPLPVPSTPEAMTNRRMVLNFVIPDEPRLQWVTTNAWGTLQRLRDLAADLARLYPWQEAQAVSFVLTDQPPSIEPVEVAHTIRQPAGLTRIHLTVDPALSPPQVATRYAEVRTRVFGGLYRKMTEKHTELALFTATHQREETLAEKRLEWNTLHPEWEYNEKQHRTFGRDCREAVERVLGGTFDWITPEL